MAEFPVPINSLDTLRSIILQWEGGVEQPIDDAAFVAAFERLSTTDLPTAWRPITKAAFASLAGWKQKRIVEALRRPLPKPVYSFPHATVISADIFASEDLWGAGVVGVTRSDNGETGVFFVELPDRRAVCIKVPSAVGPEFVGAGVCRRLGIRAPGTRVVARSSQEGRSIIKSLLAYDIATHGTAIWESSLKIFSAFNRHWFLLFEYVPGVSLGSVHSNAFDGVLQRPQTLHAFGGLIAFDVLINNHDRLAMNSERVDVPGYDQTNRERGRPACVRDGSFSSNPGNVYLAKMPRQRDTSSPSSTQSDGGSDDTDSSIDWVVTAIDNVVRGEGGAVPGGLKLTRRGEEAEAARLHRIAILTKALALNPDVPLLAGVRDLLLGTEPRYADGWPGLGIDIGDEGTVMVQSGFLSMVRRIVAIDLGLEKLREDLVKELGGGQAEGQAGQLELLDENAWTNILHFMFLELGAHEEAGIFFSKAQNATGSNDRILNNSGLELVEPACFDQIIRAFREGLDSDL